MARNTFDIDEKLESKFSLKQLGRCWVYMRRHLKKIVMAFLLSVVATLLLLTVPLVMQRALDVTLPNGDIPELVLLSVYLLAVYIIYSLLAAARGRISNAVGQNIIYEIRQDLFEHLQKLPFTYYDDRPHGKILVRVVNYVNHISDILSNGIINFILDLLSIIFIVGFMLYLDYRLALIVLTGLPVLVTILMLIKPRQRRSWQSYSNKNANLNAYLNECINGVRIIQFFTREEMNSGIFATQNRNAKNAWMSTVYVANVVSASVENISTIMYTMLYMAGMLWFSPAIPVGVLFSMSNYVWRFWQPISSIAAQYNHFMNAIAYLERIFEVFDEPVVLCDTPDAYELPLINGTVEFRDVTFGYEPGINVLENVSFKIEAGQSVALVGPTGAGKTTIVNLLSRFYDIGNGDILIDGNNIKNVTLHSLRSQMGIMLQDSFIFSGTLGDNIKYGRPSANMDLVERAAEAVNAAEFIDKLPEKYDTEVAERGSVLSQGQKQLVSFARTFITDPRILVLDEATSAIDTKTERQVQLGINTLLKGRTSFIIAHRLSTIRNCDKIMYIDHHGVAESGTHDQLMDMKGLYYRLYMSQIEGADGMFCGDAAPSML